ncbi:MAG: hypothetical protein ACRDJI_02350 [Actinomycetota bacterium]
MLLFRSEEHLDRWLLEQNLARGETLTVGQQWELARIWHSNRMDADWRRRTPQEAQEVFTQVGLTSEFWKLTAATG